MSVRRSAGGVWIEKRKKKDMSLILCIETGTDICSVGLARDGELDLAPGERSGRDHARQVGVFVDELLSQTGIAPEELDAVAVGKGPAPIRGCVSAFRSLRDCATGCGSRWWRSVPWMP